MKILMIIRKLRYSGAYKMFMWLAKALADSGLDVTVCTWANNDVKTLQDNIKWIKLDMDGKGFFTVSQAIRKIVKEVNADASISFLLDGNVYNTIGCLGRRTKSVICERNDPFKPGYYKLKFWKPLFRFADGAVFQLPKVAEYYNNVKGITTVISNPVLSKEDYHLESFENRPDIINVLGRLDVFQKRHDVMIEAFSIFAKHHPAYKLVFYGDGPDKNKMEDQVESLGIKGKVEFAGITNQPMEVMLSNKMFVLTSDFEGIPNSLIEAMSLGLPCISTDCRPGGARFLIEDGVNGFIVSTNDAKAIADKMEWFVCNPTNANEIGQRAKQIVDKYSEAYITELWNKYLSKLQ